MMDILKVQEDLQKNSFGLDLRSLDGPNTIQQIKDMKLALDDELHEMMAECGWKPWASDKFINDHAMRGELIDALHFLLNLMILSGFKDWDEVEAAYLHKRGINERRQEEGYDGVSTKCPACKRAMDDDSTTCKRVGENLICMQYGPVRFDNR